jgi:transcriptional regulator with XRE-family HTH domain
MPVLTAEQSLGARAMLRLTREQVAEKAQVAVATLADFETGRRQPHPRTLSAIRVAFEDSGIEFIKENGGGAGVRLRKSGNEQHTPGQET